MPNIATINGIAEDNIATYNGGTSSLYTSKNGDTWVHNVAPTNPADNMVDFGENSSQAVTFAGATDDGSVVAYLVDNISNGTLTVSTAEVSAGSAHTFNSGAVSSNTTISFRVRAKDNLGVYSTGITMNTIIENQLFAGSNYGYASGSTVVIQRYSLTSNGNSVNVASLPTSQNPCVGTQSKTYSFTSGSTTNGIYKHQFNTGNNSTLIGTLSSSNKQAWAGSSSSPTHGYHYGGGDPTTTNRINRWAFASSGNAVNSGTLSNTPRFVCGGSDWVNSYAYWAGGSAGSYIGRFAYGSSANGVSIGNLPQGVDAVQGGSGPCSTTHGYTYGGYYAQTTISKYSFASTTTSSNVGTCGSGWNICCSTSTTKGYGAGGSGRSTTIDNITLSSGGTASAVGTLATGADYPAGSHY